jgi:hypothetical protein
MGKRGPKPDPVYAELEALMRTSGLIPSHGSFSKFARANKQLGILERIGAITHEQADQMRKDYPKRAGGKMNVSEFVRRVNALTIAKMGEHPELFRRPDEPEG